MFEDVTLALWAEFIAGKAGGVSLSSSIDNDIDGIISLSPFAGLAFGVVFGDSSGEETLTCGTSEIAGTEAAESDVEFVEIGNDDPCRSNGNCIDAFPLPLLLPLLLSPRPAHKNAHTSDGNELDRWEATAAPGGPGVEVST